MTKPPSRQIAIIPCRLDSNRLPNKVLQEIGGITILSRVITNVKNTNIFDKIIVATDSKKIVAICEELGVEFLYMEEEVSCGSERAYYVYQKYPMYRHYVTFPADEPMLDPEEIKKMWEKHINTPPQYDEYIRTCWSKFYSPERIPLTRTCKIVADNSDYVIYFSRAPIPYSKNGLLPIEEYKKHIGIFIFNHSLFTSNISKIWKSSLSEKEGLEQIAFIENGLKVKLIEMDHKFHGIDIQEDIENIERLLK